MVVVITIERKKKYVTLFTDIWTLDLHTWEWSQVNAIGDIPKISDFLNVLVIGNHLIIGGGWYSDPYAFDTVSRKWKQLPNKNKLRVNNNDTSATLIGNNIYYFGGFFNTYKHHFYKLDLSHLSFLTNKY